MANDPWSVSAVEDEAPAAAANPWAVKSEEDEQPQTPHVETQSPAQPPAAVTPQPINPPPPAPAYDTGPKAGKPIDGMVQQGNIDVNHRPSIANEDGSHSSIYSMTIPVDKDGSVWKGDYDKAPSYALVPSIANGKFLTPDGKMPAEDDKKAKSALEDAASDYYAKSRQHLGIFSSADAADKYAGETHAYSNDGTGKRVFAPSYSGETNLPAGAPDALPGIPSPPQPNMTVPSVGQALTGENPAGPPKGATDTGAGEGTDQFLHGLQQLSQSWGDDFNFNSKDAKQGLTNTINGLMTAAGSTIVGGSGKGLMDAPGATGALLKRAGPMAARALAAGIVGGYITGKAAREATKLLGLDPDSQDLAESLGNIVGGTAAAHWSAHTGEGVRPEYQADLWEVEKEEAEPEEPKELPEPKKEPEPPSHPSGKVTGYDEKDGLPIVDRSKPSEEKPAKTDKPAPTPKEQAPASGDASINEVSPKPTTEEKPAVSQKRDKASDTTAIEKRPPAPKGEILPPETKPLDKFGAIREPVTLEGKSEGNSVESEGKVGEKEPDSGRVITQPTDKLADAQKLATAAAPELKDKLATITGPIEGARVDGIREEKDRDRALEKAKKQDQPVETISDLLAGRVAVDSPQAKDQVVAALKSQFPVIKEEDRFTKGDPDYGFRSHDLQLQMGNGSSAEVQVVPREIAEAEKETHENYEQGRKAELAGRPEEAATAQAANREIHDAAMDKFNARQKQGTGETKYKFGSTQIDLPQDSDAHKAITAMQSGIAKEHLANDGTEEEADKPHLTVRYGLKGEDTSKLRDYISKQAPFEAKLGKTAAFPVSEHSDGAAPVVAPVESPELHRINAEIEKHGDFAPSSFPEYKPHVTLGYVKPEHAQKYVGMQGGEGKSFQVRSISISDRNGGKEEVPLRGVSIPIDKGSPQSQPGLTKGAQVVLPDGRSAKVDFYDGKLTKKARVTTESGEKIDSIAGKDLTPLKPIPLKPNEPWVGFDLDKTLAKYDKFKGPLDIGKPIGGEVAEALRQHLAAGDNVRILTARVAKDPYGKVARQIQAWMQHNFGAAVPVTHEKDAHMVRLYDDRAVAVEPNTGKILGGDTDVEKVSGAGGVPERQEEAAVTAPTGATASPAPATGPPANASPGSRGIIIRNLRTGGATLLPDKEEAPEPVRQEVAEKSEPKEPTLTKHLAKQLGAGEMPKDNNALRKMVQEYDGSEVDNARLKEGQEALEVAIVRRAREIIEGNPRRSTLDTFTSLRKLYDSQPNLNIRTSDSIARQAYSTPAPLAFIASKLAGIDHETTVYEPTAGTGMLLIGADPAKAIANEIDRGRANYLEGQGFQVRPGHALTHEIDLKSVDAVITNPPFGSVKDAEGKPTKVLVDGYKIGQIDHLIAARALDAMKDDGKATLILGANKVPGGLTTDDRIFFNWLYSHYNVNAHFEVSGDLYARQGAGWPVRVIQIEGRVRSDRFSPIEGTILRAYKWIEVYDRYEDSLGTNSPREIVPGHVGAEVAKPLDEQQLVPDPAKNPTAPGDLRKPRAGATVVDRGPGAIAKPLPNSEVESAPGLARTDSDVRPDADVARSDRLPEGAPSGPSVERAPRAPRAARVDLTDADSAFQVEYTPASGKKDTGILIPTNMRDPLEGAMEKLEDKVGDIDRFATRELGYKNAEELHDALMGLQVDSVAAAIQQMKAGKAVIIADQTGIGKGRQAAAIIRWAVKQGHIPIFMSAKPSLFTDMYGDLADIGTSDVNPFIVNSDEWITLPNGDKAFQNNKGTHRATLEKIRATGELPEGRNAVFLTYSQINTGNTQQGALLSLAHKAIIVMDESHNAAGDSATGEYMGNLLAGANGVTYLSATYAKRPDNMPLYFKTDMGAAIKDPKKLDEVMSRGGLPLQTVISNNLVKSGQMFRRERSYAGVDIATKVDTARKAEHTIMADKATEVLRAIVRADKAFHNIFVKQASKDAKREYGGSLSGSGNKSSAGVSHTQFTSVVHNFVRQMLLGLKADTAASEAIAAIKAGKKPLIAVEHTMGSFLHEYAENNGLSVGQPLGDFTYKNVLRRALDRTRRMIKTDAQGHKTPIDIPYEKLDPETQGHYDKAIALIDKLDLDIPVSPIDWMRKRITDAGHTVAEITGRGLSVDYSKKKPMLAAVSKQEQTDKVETTRRFNDGRTDALILNVAGSTGISLHASEKFRDQRPRQMIVAQPAQDINIFMQMLGRIHRTGQVELPSYKILNVDLPAEKRPTALLSKKMKSLNANTSSNTESATSIKTADLLNKYGDQVVADYLEENKDLAKILDVDAKGEDGKATQDLARIATGRLALLPVKVQEAFYNDVERQYFGLMEYLNDTNQNDLEPRTFDYDAKLNKSKVLLKGEDPSTPFGEDAVYGEYSIKAQTKPMTVEEVTGAIEKNLGGKTPAGFMTSFYSGLRDQFNQYLATLPEDSTAGPQLMEVANRATDFLQRHQIGSTLVVFVGGDEFPAAITNIESTHKGTGNPFAMSKISVTLATTGSQPRIRVPASQFEKIAIAPLSTSAKDIFSAHRPSARETAKIVTGNLLGGYGQLKGAAGTIISFTKESGAIEQGILLPKKFDVETDVSGDYQLRTGEQVANFLKKGGADTEKVGVASLDGNVRITRRATGDLLISTPKSKARGAQFFLDKKLTGIVGDFVSVGETMKATVPKGREVPAIEAILAKTALYVPKSMAAEAATHAPGGGITLRSGFLDPEMFKQVFGGIGERISDWLSDDIDEGDKQAEMMRQTRGEMDRRVATVMEHVAAARRSWTLRSRADSMNFWNAIENDDISSLPAKDQPLAKFFLTGYQPLIKQIQALKPEALQNLIENYFPHIWEDPAGAAKIIRAVLTGKRPFAGRASFLKQRSIPTMQDGIDLGLTPKSWNPVDMFLLKYAEMAQYLMGYKTLDMMKTAGTAKFVRVGQKGPDGWKQLDDKISTIYRKATVLDEDKVADATHMHTYPGGKKKMAGIAIDDLDEAGYTGVVLVGHYFAPEEAARVFNNFVSRGLAGRSQLYDAVNWANQNMNALQLGISAFHATTTAVNAATSEIALGIKQLSEGKPLNAAGHIIVGTATVPSIIRTVVNGGRMMREYLSPGSYAKMAAEARAIATAGGRIKQNTLELKPFSKMVNALRNGAAGEAISSIPGAILQSTVAPVMDYWVPRMKLGAFYDMAHDVFDQAARKGHDKEWTRREVQKAWDSIDNRFGQIVYDNLFWHKGLRDSLQLATRSVGWNFGDVRELGGGVTDTIREANKALHGEAPKVTDRMAFTWALPIYTALVAGLLTYLSTGKRPDSLKHAFYWKRGDGTYVSIPGYMKDVVAFSLNPVGTVLNKLSPIFEALTEAIENKDFYGIEIRHKDDNPVKQFIQFTRWATATLTPFAFTGTQKLLENKGSDASFDVHHPLDSAKRIGSAIAKHPGDLVMGNLGFQPASANIQNSPALNMARDYQHENQPPGTKTQEQADHNRAMHAIEQMYRTGNEDKALIQHYLAVGAIANSDLYKARVRSKEDPLKAALRSPGFTLEQMLNVYEAADDREKAVIKQQVMAKAAKIPLEPNKERRQELSDSYRKVMGIHTAPPAVASIRGATGG